MLEKFLNALVDVALISGVVFLSYHDREGWGWLVFILFIKYTS